MMKKISLIIGFVMAACWANSQQIPAPYRLRTDLLLHASTVSKNGLRSNVDLESAVRQKGVYQFARIFQEQPGLHWEIDSSIKQVSAYRVLVASSAAILDRNKADYWDSKKISSTHSGASYKGKPLEPGRVYYWKVQVWNEKNNASPFSANMAFFKNEQGREDSFSHYPLAAEWQYPVANLKTGPEAYFFDFGKDAFAQLHLRLSSKKTDSVWIEAGEALDAPGSIEKTGGNIRYTRRGLLVEKGTHDYAIDWPADAKRNSRNPVPMPAYIGEVFPFRYLSLKNFSGDVNQESIQRKTIFYPFDESASGFVCSDTVLNKVWDLCRYSMKATSFTGYYIDGDRERLPYEADALINQLSHYAVDAEYSMARQTMGWLLFHPTWPTEWSLQNIPLAWNDYLYTGDDSFLKKYYTELQKKLLIPLAGTDGLISTRTGKQTDAFLASIHILKDFDGKHGLKDNVDWPQTGNYTGNEKEFKGETDGFVYTDYNAVVNAWYYHGLVLMQEIALTLGKTADAAFYDKKAKQVYHSFQQVFRDPHTGLIKDGEGTTHSSLHANMFALAFGLVPAGDVEKLSNFIKTRRMACSVYGAQFLLDALYDAGQEDYALELLSATTQRSWYNMIRTGSTITMEAWDKLYKPNLDLNHAWGAAPANLIVRKLMGLRPLTPGWETFEIRPRLGKLHFAQLTTTTLKGMVSVSCKKNEESYSMEVIIPGAAKARIVLPFNPQMPQVWVDGKKSLVKPQGGFFIIENLAAGKHLLTMQKK